MFLTQLIKDGKGKTVYACPDANVVILKYKDTITGHPNGMPDPGGNQVVGAIPDSSTKCLGISLALYQVLQTAGIPVAQTERISPDQIKVEFLQLLPLEVICRNRATGSFLRRYGQSARQGQALNGLIEFTLKNDALGDPLIVEDAVIRLGLLNREDINATKAHTTRTNNTLQAFCAGLGLELWDFKVEFGRRPDGVLVLRDELSNRTARFYRNGNLIGVDELFNALQAQGLIS